MKTEVLKRKRRLRRKRHIRRAVSGTAARPRLTVFRSNKHIYGQIIDDERGVTLVSASTIAKDIRSEVGDRSGAGGNRKAAELIGELLAARAREAGIARVVFDRNGYKFHGRVKDLAEAARKGGLEF